MVTRIQKFIRTTDATVAGAYLSLFRERNALIPFLFHSLFANESQIGLNHIDPLDRITVDHFRRLIEHFQGCGYRFVSPEEVLAGLPAGGKYALITFDDGYYNNTLALPVLEALNVPALFFISTEHVRLGKCYWWDVLYRQRRARGASEQRIYRESQALKKLPTERIEEELSAEFGKGAFTPRGEIDRPFTPDELKAFARHPLVRIGNHTANHAILTNYSPADARRQVLRAQEWLGGAVGEAPAAIAYPNGDHDETVIRECREVGLRLGFSVRPAKTALPLEPRSPRTMHLGRFTPHAHSPLPAQCRAYRSDLQLYGSVRSGYLKLCGRGTR